MNAWVLALLSYLLLGAELALKDLLALGPTGVAPIVLIPLVVYVVMLAPPTPALWYALSVGVALDLTNLVATREGGQTLTLVGPHAMGFLLMAHLVLATRGLLMKRNPVSIVFLSVVSAVVEGIVAIALVTLRARLHAELDWHATQEFVALFGAALYTGAVAAVLWWPLLKLTPLLGLSDHASRRIMRRVV
ncbi:MAG: hypothetical protein JNM07_02005 [Phycisphaerae bacterium]|nr:hypothetical protein [Phycisphaerae bacterium]